MPPRPPSIDQAFDIASDITDTIGSVSLSVGSIAGAVSALADLAEAWTPSPQMREANARKKRAREIGRLARRLARDLARIDGPVDTVREARAWARCEGWRAELTALGVDVP